MPIHNFAFWFCAFFLIGVLLASTIFNFLIIALITAMLALYFLFFRHFIFSLFSLVVFAGVFYYQIFDFWQKNIFIPFDQQVQFSGVIKNFGVLELEPPYSGKVKINSRPYPAPQYGDLIKASGIIKKPPVEAANYFAKDGIAGIVNFPQLEIVESGRGNFVKSRLLNFKNEILSGFKRTLPSEKAALLSGLTLGERGGFSKELRDQMALSGTTHIVALSGYNISVISLTVVSLFGLYFSRSISFYLSVLVIILFVLMTGAEASVVRAAIMGIIAILAKETERLFSMRNAIIIAAFLMVLHNPKVLVFDLGFQLSFAALLGIVYLLPVLLKVFRVAVPGFLDWKENLLTTLSAQLAVVPLLLSNFGIFSLTSLAANVLIAEAIPITMGLGFAMAGLGFLSEFLAQLLGLAVNLLLTYELWIIGIFSKITLPIATESFGIFAGAAYYLLLISLAYAVNKKR